jgi:hypothetical protein
VGTGGTGSGGILGSGGTGSGGKTAADAGPIDCTGDCPPLDAGRDVAVLSPDVRLVGAIAPGCDLSAAAKAIADLGLIATTSAETLNATLPSPLSGPDWGLKAIICRDGGYDISALAGQTVCLVKQPIVHPCEQSPCLAWVVMSGGDVKCVYESDDSVPGLYPPGDYTYLCP